MRLGTCIIQIGPRTAPMLASGAAAVDSLGPGRFALGIGVSSEAIISGWHGLDFAWPLERARETVVAVRKLLSRERSNEAGGQVRSKGDGGVTSPCVCALDKSRLDASLGAFARRKV